MRSTFKANYASKLALVRQILDNPVYLPGSGLRQRLEDSLAKRLSMADLRDLALVLGKLKGGAQ